jgi:drug/metabolite transporter (DMT)-like permease
MVAEGSSKEEAAADAGPPAEPRRPVALKRRATPIGLGAVLSAIVAFSLINVLIKLSHASAIVFAFYRLWIGAAAMVAVSVFSGRTRWRRLAVTIPGGALFGLNIVLFFSALKRTSVADVLIIAALQPALTLVVAGRLFGERVGAADVAGTLVSIGGVVLVTVGSSGTPAWSLSGDLLAFGSLLAFTVYFLISKRVRRTLSAVEYMTGVTITAAIVVTPLALLTAPSLRVRPVDWVWLVVFVIGAQGGHVLLAWAHEQVDVSVSSLLVLAEPIVSAAAALLVLGERVTPLEIAGGLTVIGAMVVVTHRSTRVQAWAPLPTDAPPA